MVFWPLERGTTVGFRKKIVDPKDFRSGAQDIPEFPDGCGHPQIARWDSAIYH
jgi:hypothetical protein